MLYGCHCRKFLVEDGQPRRLCGLNKRDDEDRHGSAVPAGGGLNQEAEQWRKGR